jgi:hypothetical protein
MTSAGGHRYKEVVLYSATIVPQAAILHAGSLGAHSENLRTREAVGNRRTGFCPCSSFAGDSYAGGRHHSSLVPILSSLEFR